eukprot:6206607-Pleurochrysis_carterae.AAC.1
MIKLRYRQCLPRSPIGRLGPPDQDYARLHLACALPFDITGPYQERPSGFGGGNRLLVLVPTTNVGEQRGRGG